MTIGDFEIVMSRHEEGYVLIIIIIVACLLGHLINKAFRRKKHNED